MDRYLPIGHLSVYRSKSFCVCAKVVRKEFRDLGQDKALLTADLMDNHGELIRSKMWGDDAKKWNASIKENSVYEFKNGKVAVANKRYNNLPHLYELTFDSQDASISEVSDNDIVSTFPSSPADYPDDKIKPVKLRTIYNDQREPPFIVDLVGVVKAYRPCDQVVTKRNSEMLQRRTITLVDDTGFQFQVTLFGTLAETDFEDQGESPTISISRVMIREYRGKNGQATSMSKIVLNGTTPEHQEMKNWWADNQDMQFKSMQNVGDGTQTGTTTEVKTIEDVFDESQSMGPGETKTYELFGVEIDRIFHNHREKGFVATYPACPTCNRKVADGGGCENCNKTTDPSHRFMCTVSLSDSTGSRLYATAFDNQLSKLLNCDANSIRSRVDENGGKLTSDDMEMFEYDGIYRQGTVVLRSEVNTYQGENRPRYRILNLELSTTENAKKLLSDLSKKIPGLNSKLDTRKRKMSVGEENDSIKEKSLKV
eukprot:GHVP01047633.1.p1 GENE.GHVP01047633.1~~GHVP01047633.1.p1  ORF type:complete len:483 (+),score=89.19 GHVP01047633.1:45-1493(+)